MSYEKYKYKNRFIINEARRQQITDNNIFSYGLSFLDRDFVGILPYELVVVAADSGVGKAQRLTDMVLTPNGWRTMGDINIGDFVIGADGQSKKVTNIPFQGKQDVYKIITDDGRECYASENHDFLVRRVASRKKMNGKLSVKQMLLGMNEYGIRFFIENTKPIHFNKRELPIDPYVLGAILGDGYISKNGVSITCNDVEIPNIIASRLPDTDRLSKRNTKERASEYGFVGKDKGSKVYQNLLSLGLGGKKSATKFIPHEYIYSSLGDRIELLRGLMDTDGYIVKNKKRVSTRYGITTISEEMAGQIKEIVLSLGGKVSLCKSDAKLKGRFISKKYVIIFSLPSDIVPFHLSRKRDLVNADKPNLFTFIKSIEYTGNFETKCITVDGGLYITNDYLVTSNSQFAVDLAIKNISQGKKVMYFALEGGDEDIHHRIAFKELKKKGNFNFAAYRYNLDADITDSVMGEIYENLGDIGENLYVYFYDGTLPGMDDVLKIMDDMKDEVDMFVVDHLHYINLGDERDEYKAISRFMEAFKEVTKILRKPVILISHTRGHTGGKRLEPSEYDLHGSTNIAKQADTIILISVLDSPDDYEDTDTDRYPPNRYSYTRINVAKTRVIGMKRRFVGPYDMREKKYIDHEFYPQKKKTQAFKKTLK